MEETNGMASDKTNIDRGQGSSDSTMRLSLIFSSLGLFLFCLLSTFSQFAPCVQKLWSLAARCVRFNTIPAGAVETFSS
jgi:hypothetical protein